MNWLIIGNIISLCGALLMVAGGFVKERRNILLLQCGQFGVMAAGNFLLGGYTGVVSNLLSVLRNLYCLKRELRFPLAAGLAAVQMALTLAVNTQGILGWLPVAATVIFTFSINTQSEKKLKAVIVVGQLCWGIYDLMIRNYASLVFDVLTVASNIWGIAASGRSVRRMKQEEFGKNDQMQAPKEPGGCQCREK